MDTKEPTPISERLKHNWELGSGGAGPIGSPRLATQGRAINADVEPTNEDLLRQMSANLKTQDNSATQDPMFVVYEKLLIVGLEDGYQESWSWITDDDGDTEEADSDLVPVLTKLHDDCEPLVIGSRTYRKIGIKYVDKFCAAFLTRKGAEDYSPAQVVGAWCPGVPAAQIH